MRGSPTGTAEAPVGPAPDVPGADRGGDFGIESDDPSPLSKALRAASRETLKHIRELDVG